MTKIEDLTPEFPIIPKELEVVNAGVESFSDFVGTQSVNTPISIQQNHIESANFSTLVSGWRINADGNVEFNSGTFRGTLTAGQLHIPDQDTTADSFHTDSDGNSWWGATTLVNSKASITKDGIAKFEGASIVQSVISTAFEDINRFGTNSVGGSGAFGINNSGLYMNTGTTASSYSKVDWQVSTYSATAGLIASASVDFITLGTAWDAFIGLGYPTIQAAGVDWNTGSYIGFKISGEWIYGTTRSGGVISITSALTTAVTAGVDDFIIHVSSANLVTFYVRRGTNFYSESISTNIPSDPTTFRLGLTNSEDASNTAITFKGLSIIT